MGMNNVSKLKDKQDKKNLSDEQARDILKPTCDEELREEDYSKIKDDK